LSGSFAGTGLATVDIVAKAYENKTVDAIATALASAIAEGDGCGALVSACASTGESAACCDISVGSAAASFSKDAVASVSALL
jgi:hypothetical protein